MNFHLTASLSFDEDTVIHDPKCDCYSHPHYYNNYNFNYEDYYDSECYNYDYRINFYEYLESKCLNKKLFQDFGHDQHIKNANDYSKFLFTDETLNLNLLKLKVEQNDKCRVGFILDLLNKNFNNYTSEQILKLLKSLVCWQSQFNDLTTIEHIAKFALDNSICKDLSKLADFVIESNETSTLNYRLIYSFYEKYNAYKIS